MGQVADSVGAVSASVSALPAGGKSAARVLHMLSVFQGATGPLGLTELARRADLPKSTAFRLLATLEGSGYLERRDADYVLSGHLLELGRQARVVRHGAAVEMVHPYLCELFGSSRSAAGYATLVGERAVLIEAVGVLLRDPRVSVAASAALLRAEGRCASTADLAEHGISILADSSGGQAGVPVYVAPHPLREGVLELAVVVAPAGQQPGAFVLSAAKRAQVPVLTNLLRSAARHFAEAQAEGVSLERAPVARVA